MCNVREKLQPGVFEMQDGQAIEPMEENDSYKYLGMLQVTRIYHRIMKDKLTTVFTTTIRRHLMTNLNSINLFKALNTYVFLWFCGKCCRKNYMP